MLHKYLISIKALDHNAPNWCFPSDTCAIICNYLCTLIYSMLNCYLSYMTVTRKSCILLLLTLTNIWFKIHVICIVSILLVAVRDLKSSRLIYFYKHNQEAKDNLISVYVIEFCLNTILWEKSKKNLWKTWNTAPWQNADIWK